MPPILCRSLVLFIACAILFQLTLYFHSAPSSSSSSSDHLHHSSDSNPLDPDSQPHYSSSPRSHDPARNRHPTVPLSLKHLQVLDQLADTIATTEAFRVFENQGLERIRGASIENNPSLVRQIRDQIDCWTTHGSWQRQDNEFTWIQHMGDSRFTKCDKTFMRALDRHGNGNGHSLGEYDHVHNRLLVREAVKYKWVPDEKVCGPGSGPDKMGLADARASYQPFTKTQFCQAIGHRHLLLVGDITQYQLHDVILSAFQGSGDCYGELGCHTHGICPGSVVKFSRNDLLSVPWAINPEEEEYPSASTVEQPWATVDMLRHYKVLILNRGLIWRPDEVFLNELVFALKHVWKDYPDTLILYRATHPVSPNCTQFKHQGEDEAIADRFGSRSVVQGTTLYRPLGQPPKRHEIHGSEKPEYRPTLADIQRQNRIAKVVIEAAGGIFLDTEAMFARRPDGRMGDGDCARFCAPGPLDAYADLLYNTFRIL